MSDPLPVPSTTASVEAAERVALFKGTRDVHWEHSPNLADVLSEMNVSLLISTSQAEKVVTVGVKNNEEVMLTFHSFDRPMGLTAHPSGRLLAIADRDKVWVLRYARGVSRQLEPQGTRGGCFLTRSAYVTGEIQAKEVAWSDDELWIVNTRFSCLCSPSDYHSFVPRWKPSFITALVPEDRCHLNGLALVNGRPKYVTALAETDTAAGWRANKVDTGCLLDVQSGETVARGFAMPHSPRVHLGATWLLDSGRGTLIQVEPRTGEALVVAKFPGFTRGLAMIDRLAFVGLSKIRADATFGGAPIAELRETLKCGIGIVDVYTGRLVGQLEFSSGIEEVFDVALVPNARSPVLRGPCALEDGDAAVWTMPPHEPSSELPLNSEADQRRKSRLEQAKTATSDREAPNAKHNRN